MNTEDNVLYLAALRDLEGKHYERNLGLVNPESTPANQHRIIISQNNAIIAFLAQLSIKIEEIDTRIIELNKKITIIDSIITIISANTRSCLGKLQAIEGDFDKIREISENKASDLLVGTLKNQIEGLQIDLKKIKTTPDGVQFKQKGSVSNKFPPYIERRNIPKISKPNPSAPTEEVLKAKNKANETENE